MSWNWNSHGLPFLPGYTFQDVTKSAFHRPQTLAYKNGYAVPSRPSVGIGHSPLISAQLRLQEISDLALLQLEPLDDTSDSRQNHHFTPAHVALDKKVLRFFAFFTEEVQFSPEERLRVRPVVLYYYLEDDTMRLIEPAVENSGMPQGVRLKRQRVPKDQLGGHYTWTDLNVAMNLEVYGVKYRICHCDAFTKEFLTSEGIVLNDPEPMPTDLYTEQRVKQIPSFVTTKHSDQAIQFHTMDRKVLRFFGLWDDSASEFGDTLPVIVHYYLVDDTVEVREVHEHNSGRDHFPVLMRRQRLPKTTRPHIEMFPSCVLELSKHEVEQFFSPKDFVVGQKVTLLGRHFLLCDCDGFTRLFYQSHYPELELRPVDKSKDPEQLSNKLTDPPPYNGFGTVEDSLQNCLRLVPQVPKKNLLQQLENDHKVLRYKAKLVSQSSVDEERSFILSYFVASDMISIYEKSARNTGVMGAKFLEKTRVPKPGSSTDKPDFYSPADLAIGATVEVFGHRFLLTDADRYVLTYLESIQSQVPTQTMDSLRTRFGLETKDTTGTTGEDAVVEPST